MSFAQILIIAVYLLIAVAGLGLVLLGAWGSLRIGRYGTDSPLAPKQRVLVTILGLFALAAVWHNLSGRLPLGR